MASQFPDVTTVQGVDNQRSLLEDELKNLRLLVNNLPASLPAGAANGPFMRYFTEVEIDEEGPWYAVDRAWNRTFQVPDAEQLQLVTRGEYGISVVAKFFVWAAALPGLEAYNGLYMVAERVHRLNALVGRA